MTNVVGANYWLCNDIDLQNQPFLPIGATSTSMFRGTFDGNNHIISNLTITQTFDGIGAGVGLFRGIGVEGSVVNLTIENPEIIYGQVFIGSLAGRNEGTINNCRVTGGGVVIGSFPSSTVPMNVGGLVGQNTGVIQDSSVIGYHRSAIRISGANVGGLVGWSLIAPSSSPLISSIRRVSVMARVDVYDQVGGGVVGKLAGNMSSAVSTDVQYARSLASMYRMHPNGGAMGGLIGEMSGNVHVDQSYALGWVNGLGGVQTVGGLIGKMSQKARLSNCFAMGNVLHDASAYAGGLVGFYSSTPQAFGVSTIENCYSIGAVDTVGGFWHGLVGFMVTDGSAFVIDSFYNSDSNPNSPIDLTKGEGKTTYELKSLATYPTTMPSTWSIATPPATGMIWEIPAINGRGYPRLTTAW